MTGRPGVLTVLEAGGRLTFRIHAVRRNLGSFAALFPGENTAGEGVNYHSADRLRRRGLVA